MFVRRSLRIRNKEKRKRRDGDDDVDCQIENDDKDEDKKNDNDVEQKFDEETLRWRNERRKNYPRSATTEMGAMTTTTPSEKEENETDVGYKNTNEKKMQRKLRSAGTETADDVTEERRKIAAAFYEKNPKILEDLKRARGLSTASVAHSPAPFERTLKRKLLGGAQTTVISVPSLPLPLNLQEEEEEENAMTYFEQVRDDAFKIVLEQTGLLSRIQMASFAMTSKSNRILVKDYGIQHSFLQANFDDTFDALNDPVEHTFSKSRKLGLKMSSLTALGRKPTHVDGGFGLTKDEALDVEKTIEIAEHRGFYRNITRWVQDRRVIELLSHRFQWNELDLGKRMKEFKEERSVPKPNKAKDKRIQVLEKLKKELKTRVPSDWFKDKNVLEYLKNGKDLNGESFSPTRIEAYILQGNNWIESLPKAHLEAAGGVEYVRSEYAKCSGRRTNLQRLELLALALSTVGCKVRSDSELCTRYITYGEGDVNFIVLKMSEMKFLHSKTNYARILDQYYERRKNLGYNYDDYYDFYLDGPRYESRQDYIERIARPEALQKFVLNNPERRAEIPVSLVPYLAKNLPKPKPKQQAANQGATKQQAGPTKSTAETVVTSIGGIATCDICGKTFSSGINALRQHKEALEHF
jgi:hypothetical protein